MIVVVRRLLKEVAFSISFMMLCASCSSSDLSRNQDRVCFKERCVSVEVAQNEKDLMRGLQFRNSLSENAGMLFIFPQSGIYDFWMKDTLIPLDMIWLSDDRYVIYIAAHVPPCQKDPCPTYGPQKQSRYVLEINADKADRFNIHVGDRAEFKLHK